MVDLVVVKLAGHDPAQEVGHLLYRQTVPFGCLLDGSIARGRQAVKPTRPALYRVQRASPDPLQASSVTSSVAFSMQAIFSA